MRSQGQDGDEQEGVQGTEFQETLSPTLKSEITAFAKDPLSHPQTSLHFVA